MTEIWVVNGAPKTIRRKEVRRVPRVRVRARERRVGRRREDSGVVEEGFGVERLDLAEEGEEEGSGETQRRQKVVWRAARRGRVERRVEEGVLRREGKVRV